MKVPYNKTYQNQNKSLIAATFKKAVITSINTQLYTVDVYFAGNTQTIIKNIPLANSTNINDVALGDRCRVDCFDETNPNDMVVAYIYGKTVKKRFASGSTTVGTGGTTIPHGLNAIPNIVGAIKTASPNTTLSVTGGGGGTYIANLDIYEYQAADSTNIYLKSVNGNIAADWFAIRYT